MGIKTMVGRLEFKLTSKVSRICVIAVGILIVGGILLSLPWPLANFSGALFALLGIVTVAAVAIGELIFWVDSGD